MCALSAAAYLFIPVTVVDSKSNLDENLAGPLAQLRVPHFTYHPVVELFLPVLFRRIVDHHLNTSYPINTRRAGVGARATVSPTL